MIHATLQPARKRAEVQRTRVDNSAFNPVQIEQLESELALASANIKYACTRTQSLTTSKVVEEPPTEDTYSRVIAHLMPARACSLFPHRHLHTVLAWSERHTMCLRMCLRTSTSSLVIIVLCIIIVTITVTTIIIVTITVTTIIIVIIVVIIVVIIIVVIIVVIIIVVVVLLIPIVVAIATGRIEMIFILHIQRVYWMGEEALVAKCALAMAPPVLAHRYGRLPILPLVLRTVKMLMTTTMTTTTMTTTMTTTTMTTTMTTTTMKRQVKKIKSFEKRCG
jgi:hypothetical protein